MELLVISENSGYKHLVPNGTFNFKQALTIYLKAIGDFLSGLRFPVVFKQFLKKPFLSISPHTVKIYLFERFGQVENSVIRRKSVKIAEYFYLIEIC